MSEFRWVRRARFGDVFTNRTNRRLRALARVCNLSPIYGLLDSKARMCFSKISARSGKNMKAPPRPAPLNPPDLRKKNVEKKSPSARPCFSFIFAFICCSYFYVQKCAHVKVATPLFICKIYQTGTYFKK